jgi:diaminohydroxyphosphoribosylaminopyrimidine deaminase/5-amino-6-(5-phosphoribosylamino)uracil reductase
MAPPRLRRRRSAGAVALRPPSPPPPFGKRDAVDRHEKHMRRALELAERGWGRVSPNPLVGAVIVRDDAIEAEGWHEGVGSDHAEVMALRVAGERARGATVYSTLEPCNRVGHTPACTRALIEAGVARVIAATTDPHLGEDAPGLRELREAGIDTSIGPLQDEARRLNEAFERQIVTGLPFVTLKMAASLDGKTAAADGTSRWITGPEARADVQRLRAWADAVIVGAGTISQDDPSLTVRDARFSEARPPLRVGVAAAGRVMPGARVFDGEAPTLIATTGDAPEARVDAWLAAGAEVVVLDPDDARGVSLAALLRVLGKRDVQGVLVEGGATLAWSLVRDDLADKLVLYLAPKLVGGAEATGVLGGAGFAPIASARDLDLRSIERIGPDVKVVADVHGHR